MKKVSTLVGIIIIVAVALVAFGGVFGYQYYTKSQIPITNDQPNPNVQNQNTETTSWETYRNTEYGFEMEYPTGSTVTEDLVTTIFLPKRGDGSISEVINIISNNITFCDYAYQYYPETVKIDNVNFKKDIDRTGGMQSVAYNIFYALKIDGKCLKINFSAGGNKGDFLDVVKEAKFFGEIISTFKFTK